MNHIALALLLPAALLTWRWSRLVSTALWLTLATWGAYRGIRWQWPDVWATGHLEWTRGVSMLTGAMGAIHLAYRDVNRGLYSPSLLASMGLQAERLHVWRKWGAGRADVLSALLVASMSIDLAALLVHKGAGQWGPQPFFQVVVLLAMCAVSAWPRRK